LRRVSVKGGRRKWAQQDAGTYQMLRDECSDLCSTIASTQSLDAAIELALLLANRKTRSVLWQGDTQEEEEDSDFTNESLWNSILNVLTCYNQTETKKKKKIQTSGPTSPSRSRSRTKSARRKQKKLQTGGSSTSSNTPSTELKQVLASILCFLSWDCTLSEKHSVAAMGTVKAPYLARKVRSTILQHGDALQGAVQLFLRSPNNNKGGDIMESVSSSSVASSPRIISMKQQTTPRGGKRRMDGWASGSVSPSSASVASSVSSVSFEESSRLPTKQKQLGDPTAAGRRKRRTKRRLMQPIAEEVQQQSDWPHTILPPPKFKSSSPDFSFASDESSSFCVPKAQSPQRSVASSVTCDTTTTTTTTTTRLSPKLATLLSKVTLSQECDHVQQQDNWISMVCLQSLNRIINGKDEEGPSCIENTDDDDDDDPEEEEEEQNPILITNNLLAKSGAVPVLARAMSESLDNVTTLLANEEESVACWKCWHAKISILASLIDGACLFHEANRRAFCEDDPFSFEERNQGLVFHIILLLNQFAKRGRMTLDDKISGIVLLGLRTLTSLTHDNAVAGEQLTMCSSRGESDEESIRGLNVLTELVFALERRGDDNDKKAEASRSKDEDLHRYDSTIFCLNTLANIVEGADVRRLLAEIKVASTSGETLWLKWLCQWLVIQTASFRDAIMGIGKKDGSSSSQQRELQKNEEDKLVAAGNGCVLLACLMTEPDSISEEPESTNIIRNLIIDQMPVNKDGSSTGVTMIVNTLKAFCNFYHYSLGDLSVAIVTPVKKLIQELEEMENGYPNV
jgi:hypothetical protein